MGTDLVGAARLLDDHGDDNDDDHEGGRGDEDFDEVEGVAAAGALRRGEGAICFFCRKKRESCGKPRLLRSLCR